MAFNFEAFWRNWFGVNETLSNARSFKRNTLKALDKEIKKQTSKKDEITSRIDSLMRDKNDVDGVLKELVSEKNSINKR